VFVGLSKERHAGGCTRKNGLVGQVYKSVLSRLDRTVRHTRGTGGDGMGGKSIRVASREMNVLVVSHRSDYGCLLMTDQVREGNQVEGNLVGGGETKTRSDRILEGVGGVR